MSDQSATEGQPPEPPEQQETQQEGPPEWLNPITERMDELSESTSRLAEQFAERQQQPPEREAEREIDFYDDEGDLTPEGAQALIDQRVDERLTSVLSERDAVSALDQREDAFEALREEVPALQDDKLAARLVRETAAWCQQHGQQKMIETPAFVDLVEDRFYREMAQERIASERSEEPQREVVLESASGASQPQSDEPDWGERIVNAAERLRPQI